MGTHNHSEWINEEYIIVWNILLIIIKLGIKNGYGIFQHMLQQIKNK